MAVGAGGIILFGVIASWVFGREYSDHTLKDRLALPTSRSVIVMSKFIVIGLCSVIMTVLIFLITLGVGLALDLPPASPDLFWQTGLTISLAAGMIIGLTTTIALAASIWHGYLAPVGVLILLMGLGQLVMTAGWGEYFPWAVPALIVQGETLGIASYLIVGITTLAGLAMVFGS